MHRNGPIQFASFSQRDFDRFSQCAKAAGTTSFVRQVGELCKELCGASSVLLTAFFRSHKPALLYYNQTDPFKLSTIRFYLDVAYALDPFYGLFLQNADQRVSRLDDFAADDFHDSEYYRCFYHALGLSDEIGYLLNISEDSAILISVGASQHSGPINSKKLELADPLIASLIRMNWQELTPEQPQGVPPICSYIRDALENFGSDILSRKERTILQLILAGHSSKDIAGKLNNSPQTIKAHRKNIYMKLDVSSQGALLSLFLNGLTNPDRR